MGQMYYSAERNVQIVVALLKAHGIKKVIASPGTTNMTFVGSLQQDPWFQLYSSVDERSAAYMACGMSAECGEPVVLSCTGATASRNYMPGLTEAYYRKLPVLAITSHRGNHKIGHLLDQQIDRRVIPNDIAVEAVTLPMVKSAQEERFCEIEANKAILALRRNGGGPVHVNLFTEYNPDFSVKELPSANRIDRYTPFDILPSLPAVKRIGVFIGSHRNFSDEETKSLEKFCESNNAVVFCDHTSGYAGKYQIRFHVICAQEYYSSQCMRPDLLIHVGEVSGAYPVRPKEVWRVSEDGEIRDTFGKLTKVFAMPENVFFQKYTHKNTDTVMSFLGECEKEYKIIVNTIPELPFGNAWIASQTADKLPCGSELHMGIYNSLRSWNFFELPEGVLGKCNVGGFGIDGGISSLVGAALASPSKLFFGVFGDLAFFYDMNVLGNRHIGKNLRILLVNNGQGGEFRLHGHPCTIFDDAADMFMSAKGHFGNKSSELVKNYSKSLGFEYLTACSKEAYLALLPKFLNPKIGESPILFEVFTTTEDESVALKNIREAYSDISQTIKAKVANGIRNIVGKNGFAMLKKIKDSL